MGRTKYSLILFLFFAFFSGTAICQESNAISYRFKMPKVESSDEVSKGHYEILEQKIKGSYGRNNFFSTQTPFAIIPKIYIADVQEAGDIRTVKVVKVAVSLSIQDFDNQIQFNQFETSVIVTGNDVPLAVTKAIKQIKASDPKFKKFFTDAEKNVLDFYTNNCAKILKSAKTNIDRKEYNKAFAILKYVPESSKCYGEVERLMTKIYLDNKDENCRKMLQKAQIEKSQENYTRALYYIDFIDPNADCYTESIKLIKEIETQINKESMSDYDRKRTEFEKMNDSQKIRRVAPEAEFLQITISK